MRPPILLDAKLTENTVVKKTHKVQFIIELIFFIGACIALFYLQKLFFSFLIKNAFEAKDLISIAASIVTLLSAFISLFSLADSYYLKNYDNDLALLEERYFKGTKFYRWSFFRRTSFRIFANNKLNYSVQSFSLEIYYGKNNTDFQDFVVPALQMDFRDAPCIREIIRIKKYLPLFLEYCKEEQEESAQEDNNCKKPFYYIPLPFNLISLYKSILMHRLLVVGKVLFSLSILITIIVTIYFFVKL